MIFKIKAIYTNKMGVVHYPAEVHGTRIKKGKKQVYLVFTQFSYRTNSYGKMYFPSKWVNEDLVKYKTEWTFHKDGIIGKVYNALRKFFNKNQNTKSC